MDLDFEEKKIFSDFGWNLHCTYEKSGKKSSQNKNNISPALFHFKHSPTCTPSPHPSILSIPPSASP